MEIIAFGSEDLDNLLNLEPLRALYLPFGAMLIDRSGIILQYNKAAALPGSRTPDDFIGRDLFNEVARCTLNTVFHREFLRFHRTGQCNTLFSYDFDLDGKTVNAKIHLKSQTDNQTCWVFIKLT